jgi:hypothetical protein
MHPPTFLESQHLSDWPDCFLEVRCNRCIGRSSVSPVKGLLRWHGDAPFAEVLKRLKCKYCRHTPTFVYLCASQVRTACMGQPTGWAIELVSRARNAASD